MFFYFLKKIIYIPEFFIWKYLSADTVKSDWRQIVLMKYLVFSVTLLFINTCPYTIKNPEYLFPYSARPDHSGNYTCQPSSAIPASIQVFVLGKPWNGGVTGRPETMCPRTNVLGPMVLKLIAPCDTMSLDWYIPVTFAHIYRMYCIQEGFNKWSACPLLPQWRPWEGRQSTVSPVLYRWYFSQTIPTNSVIQRSH